MKHIKTQTAPDPKSIYSEFRCVHVRCDGCSCKLRLNFLQHLRLICWSGKDLRRKTWCFPQFGLCTCLHSLILHWCNFSRQGRKGPVSTSYELDGKSSNYIPLLYWYYSFFIAISAWISCWNGVIFPYHTDAEARDDLIGRVVQHNASLNSTFYFCRIRQFQRNFRLFDFMIFSRFFADRW